MKSISCLPSEEDERQDNHPEEDLWPPVLDEVCTPPKAAADQAAAFKNRATGQPKLNAAFATTGAGVGALRSF
eukprot:4457335-Prorocentrum_lima.AAC.1